MKDLIHEHKWKPGSEEKASTVKEIGRNALPTIKEPCNISRRQASRTPPNTGARLAGECRRAARERQTDETSGRRDEETNAGQRDQELLWSAGFEWEWQALPGLPTTAIR
jgi:hypothetical protein